MDYALSTPLVINVKQNLPPLLFPDSALLINSVKTFLFQQDSQGSLAVTKSQLKGIILESWYSKHPLVRSQSLSILLLASLFSVVVADIKL